MADFTEFRESNRIKNVAIQRVLRQIDTEDLAMVLVGLSEEDRKIFYRNMRVRAVELLKDEIAELERLPKGTYKESAGKVQKQILFMLEKHLGMSKKDEEKTPDKVPPIRWESEAELIETFTQPKRYSGRYGAIAIESAVTDELPPLLKKGLELYMDGWDPSLLQSILEQLKETLITRFINKQNMILEGIGALVGHDLPQAVTEKLRAFSLSDKCPAGSKRKFSENIFL